MSWRVPVDGAGWRYFTLTSTHPIRTRSSVRRSIGRAAPERRDTAIEMPALNRNRGNTSSATRNPCQSACTNWLGMASWSPGLLTKIIRAMASPRSASSASIRRVVGCARRSGARCRAAVGMGTRYPPAAPP